MFVVFGVMYVMYCMIMKFLFISVAEIQVYVKYAERRTMMIGLDVTDVVSFFMLAALGLTLQKPFQNTSIVNTLIL